jgi:hypothetical protein
MKMSTMCYSLVLLASLSPASAAAAAAANVAKVGVHGEADMASPFDVTFNHDSKSKSTAKDPVDVPAPTQLSSTGPFRQPTNGSTPAGWIQLGTPRKWLFVIFDTGSDKLVAKTWETVAAELSTLDQGIEGMVLPSNLIYDHNSSSSYHHKYLIDSSTGEKRPKQSSITYGSGTAITDEGTENMLIGNRSLDNFTIMEITADSLQLLHTSKGIAGVLGLQHMQNQSLGHSLFSRLRDADLMSAFGYCRGTGNNGTFIWGDDSTEGTEIEVIGQMHWAMKLMEVKVPGPNASKPASLMAKGTKGKRPMDWASWPFAEDVKDMDVNDDTEAAGADDMDPKQFGFDPEKILDAVMNEEQQREVDESKEAHEVLADICTTEKCTAILDTGSNIIAGPQEAMQAITKLVNVKSDCSNFDQLPHIAVKIGGMDLSVPPSGYVMKVPMPSWADAAGGDTKAMDGDSADTEEAENPYDPSSMGGDDSMPAEMGIRENPHDTVAEVVIVEPGYVRRHRDFGAGLSEQKAESHRARTHRQWQAVFNRLHRKYGIDMRQQVRDLLRTQNHTEDQFMCMPALVPLDKKTQWGPLWVVGTPLLDAYYARWSYGKNDKAPKIHLQALQDAKVCKDQDAPAVTPTALLRKDSATGPKSLATVQTRGPVERLPEEIAYPHWAKDLLHI